MAFARQRVYVASRTEVVEFDLKNCKWRLEILKKRERERKREILQMTFLAVVVQPSNERTDGKEGNKVFKR